MAAPGTELVAVPAPTWQTAAVPETPTLLVKFAEAGGAYLTWRWIHDDGPGPFAGMAQVSAAQVDAVRDTLARAVPDTLPGESVADGIDRALLRGPFSHPESTATLARDLGQVLLSADLVTALRQAPARPLLRIQPSESLTRVPWEMLLVDDATGKALWRTRLTDVPNSAPISSSTTGMMISSHGSSTPAERTSSWTSWVRPIWIEISTRWLPMANWW